MSDTPNTDTTASAVTLPADLSYEDASTQLDEVLDSLEGGDLALDESLALYEQGVALSNLCAQKLEEAELRVRQWQPDGEPTSFDDWREE